MKGVNLAIKMSINVRDKLKNKHHVCEIEIFECFENKTHRDLIDSREKNRTDPPTKWFLSETNKGRKLKVCYMENGVDIVIKSVFPPNDAEIEIFNRYSKEIN